MDPILPLRAIGRGRGVPIVDTSRPLMGFQKSETAAPSTGLYGVDCDFARYKQRHEDNRAKSTDDRHGRTSLDQSSRENSFDGFGAVEQERGRRKKGGGDDRRSCFASSRGSREQQRVRFNDIHCGPIDSDHLSLDTSDEGVPPFGGIRGRRGHKGKDRYGRLKRSENYESRLKQGETREDHPPMRWNETFERGKFEERPADDSRRRHEREIDYLQLNRNDRESDRWYEDERKDDGKRYGRGYGRGNGIDNRGGFNGRGYSNDDRAGFTGRGNSTDDRAGFAGRGNSTDDRAGFTGRGNVTDDRGGFAGRGSGTDDRSCYNCGEVGHISRDCQKPKKPLKTITCFTCKKDGHISRYCPEKYSGFETASGFNSASLPNTCDSDIVEMVAENTEPKDSFDFSPLNFAEQSTNDASIIPEFEARSLGEDTAILVDIGTEEEMNSVTAAVDSVTIDLDNGDEVKHEIVKVDQLFKKDTLQKMLLQGSENYKDDAICECKTKAGPFAECKCKKKVVVFVNRRLTVECVRIGLSALGLTVASVHCSMDKQERDRNLTRFQHGRYPILIMMASEAWLCMDAVKEVDWVVNLDLPIKVDEYVARIEMVHCEGKPLLVTSFYDELMDNPLAGELVKILSDAGESVPEWLSEDVVDIGGLESEIVDGEN